MIGIIDIDSFRSALTKILTVVDKKNTQPILAYSLLEASENSLTISATDLEVSVRVTIQANVSKPGKYCINPKNMFDIVRELPEGEIHFEVGDDHNLLNLRVEKISYDILIHPVEDFPSLNFEKLDQSFEIESSKMISIINKTAYAVCTDETKIFLNGIFFQEVDSKLRAVACDGHRLSLYETESMSDLGESLSNGIIIPRKAISEVKRIAETYLGGKLRIYVNDSFMYLTGDKSYWISIRLIARDYVKYQAVIPAKTSFSVTVDKASFSNAVKRIKIMSHEKSNGVRLQINSHSITLLANHPSLGKASETLPVTYRGDELEIRFNAKYLLDTLSTIEEGDVTLEINNEVSPVLIKSEKMPQFLGLIMPLRI